MERRSNKQRSEQTRAHLIQVARALFNEQGYAETGTPEIVARANVTRGALYHHFEGKQALFFAVAMEVAEEVALAIRSTSSTANSAMQNVTEGANAYFAAMAEKDRAQVLLIQAPAILTAEELLQTSKVAGSSELKEGLRNILPKARAEAASLDALTSLVSAAFDRAALEIASGANALEYERANGQILAALSVY
ncbi:MAG: TetR/AcrR family transcriptional regulator [Halioglobus sp.]